MAANDYYNDGSRPYHGAYDPTSTHQVPAPVAHPSYSHSDRPSPAPGKQQTGASPFDTVFDDHVYPSNSPMGGHSQQSFAQDTSYHSAAPGDVSPVGDDIPLRNQPGTNKFGPPGGGMAPMDSNDHVYDAEGPPRQRGKGRGRLGFGEIGMIGANKRRIPFVVYLLSIIQIAVFIGELVKAAQLTGSPIQTKPQFNPMIGPSQQVLINMGSRYVICMHNVPTIQDSPVKIDWPCPNSTSADVNDPNNKCTLFDLCGFGGVPNPVPGGSLDQTPAPHQWWRFIVPIFMHAGIIHIGFNLLLQLTLGKEIENAIGSIRFFLVYMSSGIFGFIMGGNFAATGISSTGASGALFGIIALTLLDLLYSWKDRSNPVKELMWIVIEIVISFVLGLLPGLDNFSHIGGFLMGLCLGICVLHSPNALREKIGEDHFTGPSYSTVNNGAIRSVAFPPFMRNPVGFFKGRKGLWWAWWLVRAAFLITIIVVFVVLLNNFYTSHNTCSWCKYLSCLPIKDWCEIGNPTIQSTNGTSPHSRRAFEGLDQVATLLF
ncbi:ribonuclease P protein subunit 3 [Apiospora kogelbergensis]|uniref:Rhomboid-type serine protease n=1 Tax=Apiospora kogelbergensis TaxID=1337665 RepID=A0AAW0R670_9PEZI